MVEIVERLKALDALQVVDTPPEPEFDNVAQIASFLCDAPIARVSLLTADRLWFKAKFGAGRNAFSIDNAICLHTIREPAMLIVPDLTKDCRTKDISYVVNQPHLRFYAGAVLRTEHGVPIGTLCVLDRRPRLEGLTPRQSQGLETLSRQTTSLLSARLARLNVNAQLRRHLANARSMIVAIANRTFRHEASEDAISAFRQRVGALGEAHHLLLQDNWTRASLTTVLDQSLASFDERRRYDLLGPDVMLAPNAVFSLTMLLYELGSNAVKFGALSNDSGRVRVEWSIVKNGVGPVLTLRWTERGGPAARRPEGSSAGVSFLAKGLVGLGDADLHFGKDGFRAEFRAPLRYLTED